MEFLLSLLIAVSLSMDAFSLSLVYGTMLLSKKDKIILSFIVGFYHFLMPLLGVYCGDLITRYLIIDTSLLMGIIFIIIGLEMIISGFSNEENKLLVSYLSFILFGLSVSIDSLTTGLGLKTINNNYIEVAVIFAVVSGLFTYLGLNIGYRLNEKFGKYATIGGGIVLLILGVFYSI